MEYSFNKLFENKRLKISRICVHKNCERVDFKWPRLLSRNAIAMS